jgi:glyoxylase-like metal-dependent hydrolase (beta-lactamase superfamily II)
MRDTMSELEASVGSRSPISRRAFLQAGTAAVCAPLMPYAALGQSAPHSFKVGAVEGTVISDGLMSLPLAFVLPQVDEKSAAELLASRGLSATLAAQVNVAVLRTTDRLVLIDAGGSKDFMSTVGDFADRFEAAGFKADDVTDVVLTHAHPDHLWGAIDALDEPRFAKARIHMSAVERDFWMKQGLAESMPDALKGATAGSQRRLKMLESQILAVKAGMEILPGLALVDTAGHTPGHCSVLVSSNGQSLLVGGDALSNSIVSFERPEWPWGADLDPDKGIATRKSLLDRLAVDRTPLLGYHLPWPGLGRVERKDNAYRFVPG